MTPPEPQEPNVFSVDTHWTGGIRTLTTVRGHEVVVDGPYWRYGTDDGPAPGEMLLAAVGACFVNHIVRYLQFKRVIVNSVDVKVTGEFRFAAELEVYDRFTFDVVVEAPPKLEQVVQRAFKVAQGECTMLSILDVKKEFNLTFRPSD